MLKALQLIHFIDSGGQPQFHEVFPAFIDIIFVMKLSEGLDEDPVVNIIMKVRIGIVNLIIMHLVMNRFLESTVLC